LLRWRQGTGGLRHSWWDGGPGRSWRKVKPDEVQGVKGQGTAEGRRPQMEMREVFRRFKVKLTGRQAEVEHQAL